jgi:hypothetical protein
LRIGKVELVAQGLEYRAEHLAVIEIQDIDEK